MRTKITQGMVGVLFLAAISLSSCKAAEKKEFLSEIGVCTGIDNAAMLAEAGYSYIEGNVGGFLAPLTPDSAYHETFEKITSAALPVKSCNSFLPGNLKCIGPEPDHEELLEYMEAAFQRAQLVGVERIVFGSGRSRAIPEGFPREEARKQFIDLCTKMAPLAEKYKVVVVLEPLNKGEVNFINSVAEGGQIVREVDHPNFRLLADIYHMMRENEGPESILENGDLLYHIHIAENQDRAAPGTNGEDFTPYFRALKKIGYSGRMSIECRWTDLETQAPVALQTIRDQIQTISNEKL